jgi:hypothetical protein
MRYRPSSGHRLRREDHLPTKGTYGLSDTLRIRSNVQRIELTAPSLP